jgi:lipoate-protein ligase A
MTLRVWLDLEPRDGTAQMAIDEALLELARQEGVGVLRLYRWRADTVSFGAHEAATRAWNRERLESANVRTVRRPTGGRAVWHAATDLTYAVTQPMPAGTSIRSAYRAIHGHLATALAELGADTAIAPSPPRTPGLAGGACFDTAAGGEVLVDGRKTIGSAQLLRGGSLLQHGAIARTDPFAQLARMARIPLHPDTMEACIVLPEPVELARGIARYWLRHGGTPVDDALTRRAEDASLTHEERYRSNEWTWRR